MELSLKIITPDSTLIDEKVDSASFPGTKGRFEVLKNHAPLVSSLEKGTIVYRKGNEKFSVDINSGFVEVLNNNIDVCAEI